MCCNDEIKNEEVVIKYNQLNRHKCRKVTVTIRDMSLHLQKNKIMNGAINDIIIKHNENKVQITKLATKNKVICKLKYEIKSESIYLCRGCL